MDRVGFLGLGIMGTPMAMRLAEAGVPLMVWNRDPSRCEPLLRAGAEHGATQDDVLRACRVNLFMLADEHAIDEVLGRGTPDFSRRVAGRVLVFMGTTAPEYATALAADIAAAAGTHVESPVSGSKVPAEQGRLVAMLAGRADVVDEVEGIIKPMCRSIHRCGSEAGSALKMKLAVNLYLVTTVAALAESVHFAQRQKLDLDTFVSIINAGQMASPVAEIKGAKLRERDFSAQAAIHDVRKNSGFVVSAARSAGIATPMADTADRLYDETVRLGFGDEDMAAVIRAIEHRTESSSDAPDGDRRPGALED